MIHSCYINYSGHGFTGRFHITNTLEYFPIPVSHMKRLIKICQMSTRPEEEYLAAFIEILNHLEGCGAFISHRKHKMIQDDIKVLQERLDRIDVLENFNRKESDNHEH